MKREQVESLINQLRESGVIPDDLKVHLVEDGHLGESLRELIMPEGSNSKTCGCIACALKRAALASDSVSEIEHLKEMHSISKFLNEVGAQVAGAGSSENRKDFSDFARKCEELGYPVTAEYARVFASAANGLHDFAKRAKEEGEIKEEEMKRNAPMEANQVTSPADKEGARNFGAKVNQRS